LLRRINVDLGTERNVGALADRSKVNRLPTSLGIDSQGENFAVGIYDAIGCKTDMRERGESFVPDPGCVKTRDL